MSSRLDPPRRSGEGPRRREWLVAAGLLAAWPAAAALRPRRRTAELRGEIQLEQQVPLQLPGWRLLTGMQPLLPDPRLQATLDATYTQVLARSWQPEQGGAPLMLSIAYGNDQATEATAVHRPEFCYRSQGFVVEDLGAHHWALGSGSGLQVRRLMSRLGPRLEPISYWVTLDQTATLPGLGRKWQQLRHGLAGWIADGMVLRLSTLGPADDRAWAQHQAFAQAWWSATAPALRARYFGLQSVQR